MLKIWSKYNITFVQVRIISWHMLKLTHPIIHYHLLTFFAVPLCKLVKLHCLIVKQLERFLDIGKYACSSGSAYTYVMLLEVVIFYTKLYLAVNNITYCLAEEVARES
jgi:hypothetical protein